MCLNQIDKGIFTVFGMKLLDQIERLIDPLSQRLFAADAGQILGNDLAIDLMCLCRLARIMMAFQDIDIIVQFLIRRLKNDPRIISSVMQFVTVDHELKSICVSNKIIC